LKIVVISDTHIPDRADKLPHKLLEEIKTADMLIHAGDLVSQEFYKELKGLCKELHAVKGNMDPYEVAIKLPEKEVIKAGKFKIGIMHGFGAPGKIAESLEEVFKKDKPDMIIFGHSHVALNEKSKDVIMFNPGSPTDKIFAPYNSYGVLEIDDTIKARIVRL
jgi:putative phosphoesterase